jgi:hypothetical protein
LRATLAWKARTDHVFEREHSVMVSLRGFLYLESKPNYCFDGLRAALGRRADLFCRLSYRLRVRHELHYSLRDLG